MKQRMIAMSVALLLVVTHSASAFVLSSVDGTWSNPVGGLGISYIDGVAIGYGNGAEDQIRWGLYFTADDPAHKSGLGFTGREDDGIAGPVFGEAEPFQIGQLQHFNKTIDIGSAVTQTDLSISMVFSDPAGLAHNFQLTLTVNETLNSGPNPDDVIGFPGTLPSTEFLSGGYEYRLDILGFGPDADHILTEFISVEGSDNTTVLWGQLTVTPIPAPGAILLGGIGTGLIGLLRRRRAL